MATPAADDQRVDRRLTSELIAAAGAALTSLPGLRRISSGSGRRRLRAAKDTGNDDREEGTKKQTRRKRTC